MSNNRNNDMGGHLVPYGKKKPGARSKTKCIYYSKILKNYCDRKESPCYGVTNCQYYSEKKICAQPTVSKQEEVKAQSIKNEIEILAGLKVIHKNFGEGVVFENYDNTKSYITIKFQKYPEPKKIPFPDAYINGMLRIDTNDY